MTEQVRKRPLSKIATDRNRSRAPARSTAVNGCNPKEEAFGFLGRIAQEIARPRKHERSQIVDEPIEGIEQARKTK